MLNLSEKSIFPLFESICVLNGTIQNKQYHVARFEKTFSTFFGEAPKYGLFDKVQVPSSFQTGKVKLRITYGQQAKKYTAQHYKKKRVSSLKLVVANDIEYPLKFEDRSQLNTLFALRGEYDDILIVKNGLVTDASYANIAFFDGAQWHTPSACLLKGTTRTRLLRLGMILEKEIHSNDLKSFKGFQLINALMDFEPDRYVAITNIHQGES